MEEETKNLNYECNYNIYMINNMKDRNFRSQNDRHKIVLWIKKLRQCNQSFEDMVLRNEFMYYLLTCVKNGELRPPFTEIPPTEPISKLRNLLPSSTGDKSGINTDWVEDLEKADNNIPDIYRKSPDGGAFLSQQPIPKCGAFCYLAIVSKPSPNAKWQQLSVVHPANQLVNFIKFCTRNSKIFGLNNPAKDIYPANHYSVEH